MREKELRIALVCFGGVSLAVYMHGISKEVLKLIRASRALHDIKDRIRRTTAAYARCPERGDPEHDTEDVYFELLRDIGKTLDLRVVVDIIAGASAGGINGTMLARAISHDLPMDPLRRLWLDNADVEVLLLPEARAKRFSKWFMRPFIWGAAASGMLKGVKDLEVREKISLFVRSRWFKPPLDGLGMARLMYDAVVAMGPSRSPSASLLPAGQQLDLFVTVTDYHGYHQPLPIHDPPIIHELDHHHVLRFTYRRQPNGKTESDFEIDNAASLAFAARATSSFPGAFPPARICEMDELLTANGALWPTREDFIARNFGPHLQGGIDPASVSFIDGAVLNNRPFREAISAIHGRPAYRQVDRRLVYIDPDPALPGVAVRHSIPGFFATLKGALSDIPRNQPVTEELAWVLDFNDRMRRLRGIIEEARPHVSRLVVDTVADAFDRTLTPAEIHAWREEVNARAAREAGFAYDGYVRLKLAAVRDFVSRVIVMLRGVPPRSPLARAIGEVVNAWASDDRLGYDLDTREVREGASSPAVPRWIRFLLDFDVDYRKRRLHFLIEGQNRLYRLLDRPRFAALDPALIDRLKRDLYACLERLRERERPSFYSERTRERAAELFAAAPSVEETRDLALFARTFAERNGAKLDALIGGLAAETALDTTTHDLDELLARLDPVEWQPEARMEVLIGYLGFPYWDVLTFPVITSRDAGEFHEILVDRISPQDARTLASTDGVGDLKGVGFAHFAAFLSRAYRENDYLLGRIHALDRLIDIVCDSAGMPRTDFGIDVIAVKKRAFARILDAEEKHLTASADLIAALRRRIADVGQPPSNAAERELAGAANDAHRDAAGVSGARPKAFSSDVETGSRE